MVVIADRVTGSNDNDAAGRVNQLTTEMARWWPNARVTLVVLKDTILGPDALALLDIGVEVITGHDRSWLGRVRNHYDLVIVAAGRHVVETVRASGTRATLAVDVATCAPDLDGPACVARTQWPACVARTQWPDGLADVLIATGEAEAEELRARAVGTTVVVVPLAEAHPSPYAIAAVRRGIADALAIAGISPGRQRC